ncbi:MAG: ABC-type nitrate/sulfonate/bicarbonate transport system substrate-binding protein [Phenylobacterium sp.]|jgi:ABC-type nitrate/sulfonate/bicarbonate transport system substrate-binding protein
MMTKYTLSAFMALLICLFWGFNSAIIGPNIAATTKGPMAKITLAVETSLLTGAVWVAQKKGYYRDEALDITIKEFSTGRDSFLAMLNSDAIDISTVAPTPIVFSSFDRADFSVLATFAYSYDDVKIIVSKDSGIVDHTDLTGKTIATPFGTTGQFFLASYLELNEIPSSAIKIVDIDPDKLPAALATNQVDAIVIWEPHAYQARQLLNNTERQLETSQVYRETFNFMVMNDFAKAHSATLEGFLRANLRATEFIQNNALEAQAIISQRLNIDIAVVSALWKQFTFKIVLDQSLLTTFEDEARWAITSALTVQRNVPNYLDFLAPLPLTKVKPSAVTVIHAAQGHHEN